MPEQSSRVSLLPVPHLHLLHPLYFLPQLKNAVHKSLGCWRASGNIDIDRDDPIATANHRVRIVIIASSVCATAHGDYLQSNW